MASSVGQLLGQVSSRVRHEREGRDWTQRELADRARVSLRMLAGIEREASNVSLATLDRIANALGLSFAELVREGPSSRPAGPVVAWRGKGASRGLLLQSAPAVRAAELWEWSLAPKDRYQSTPDRRGMKAMIYVATGALTLEVAGKRQRIPARHSALFASDRKCTFINEGSVVTRFVMNVVE